jgi:GNAT superfamily N-acetyltransferase
LGEVSKTLKVIYFDYGLKPVLKHGEHDQSEHGNWARGFTEDEIARIEEMRGLGPSLEDLDNVLKENDTEYTDEQLKLVVENDSDFYADATRDIDEKVDERLRKLQEEFPNHEYTEQEKATIYEDVQREMIEDYVETFRDNLIESQQIMEPSAQDPDELVPYFQEVYGVSHTGTNPDGQEVTLNTNIGQVFRDGNSIYVRGDITDEEGNMVGEISRRFFQKDGVWCVEHEVLAIPDPTYQGTGFGKALIEQSEAWYTARGMGYIEVGTAWDGARHWARAGYDWKPDRVASDLQTIANNVEYVDGFERGTPARAEFDALMSRATDGYNPTFSDESGDEYPAWDSVKSMKEDGFPLPAEFANIGYTPGATEWAGKSLMYDLRLKYTKSLTAEGQKLLDGPIDHDGDGLIYDGTAREKPAPTGGK